MAEPTTPTLTKFPTLEEVVLLASKFDRVLQFKNSLKYIQGGTNVTLDRMILALDHLAADAYLEGYKEGIKFAKTEVLAKTEVVFTPAGKEVK